MEQDYLQLQRNNMKIADNIELASQTKVSKIFKEIDVFLEYFEIKGALVTDLSILSDFCIDEEDNQLLEQKLGFKIKISDNPYLWQVINRIKKKRPGWPNA